jgi:hypothetical protein
MGVDSSTIVTPSKIQCIRNRYGNPAFWGRYLATVKGAAEGITASELTLLRQSHIKLLPIYSNFRSAVGKREGTRVAMEMITSAKRIGIQEKKVLFANVEKHFNIDDAFILGCIQTCMEHNYVPGFYSDPIHGRFKRAFLSAIKEKPSALHQTILWSAEPLAATPKKFQPARVHPNALVFIWQYKRDEAICHTDLNLAENRILKYLM